MALDPSERDNLRRKMAHKMGIFLGGAKTVSCVSGHTYEELHNCELCDLTHTDEVLVIKNRANKKMHVATSCLREMIRYQVTDVEELPRWLEKLSELRVDMEKRKVEREVARQEERKRLEKKIIVRKRPEPA